MKRIVLTIGLLLLTVPAQAQIALRGTGKAGAATNGNNVTLTFDTTPNNPMTGDTVVICGGWSSSNGANPAAPTGGYTQLALEVTGTPTIKIGCWYKVMGGSPDTTVVGGGNGNSVDTTCYAAYVLRNVNATVSDATPTVGGPNSGAANPDPAAIVTTTANAWVIPYSISQVNDASITAPNTYINQINANGNDTNPSTCGMATKLVVAAGNEDPANWTNWGAGNNKSITLAIRLAASAVAPTQIGAFTVGP